MAFTIINKDLVKVESNQYKVLFRCNNCGAVYEKAVQKKMRALGSGGSCPNCNIKDGTPDGGQFQIIKANPDLDQPDRSYN